MPLDEWD